MYLLKTGKYSLRHYINTSHNTFEVLRKKGGTFEIFKNFFKNAQAIFKTFISYSITPKGIFCDRKRNLIFGLLRKKQKTLFSVDIVNFIVCYKINDEKTVLINNISE